MKISSFCLNNYRRLSDVELMLDDQKTILVGANNSGKTSCIGALHTFLMRPENLRMRDVSMQHWQSISSIGVQLGADHISTEHLESLNTQLIDLMPRLDVTIFAEAKEAYKARDILPHLEWRGGPLGVRIAYEPEDITKLAADYSQARKVVAEHNSVSLWPKSLFDFLEKGSNFRKYIKQKHYILSLDNVDTEEAGGDAEQTENPEPRLQTLNSGALRKLIRVDMISDQRGLGTEDSSSVKGQYSEKQPLNKLLREYYEGFLNPDDFPEAGDLDCSKNNKRWNKTLLNGLSNSSKRR